MRGKAYDLMQVPIHHAMNRFERLFRPLLCCFNRLDEEDMLSGVPGGVEVGPRSARDDDDLEEDDIFVVLVIVD